MRRNSLIKTKPLPLFWGGFVARAAGQNKKSVACAPQIVCKLRQIRHKFAPFEHIHPTHLDIVGPIGGLKPAATRSGRREASCWLAWSKLMHSRIRPNDFL